MYALDAATGAERWTFMTGGAVDASPAVIDGIVYIGSTDHKLYALDAATGVERWHLDNIKADFSPLVVDGILYAATYDQLILALDAATGMERWRATLASAASRSASLANGMLYVGGEDFQATASTP